MKARLIEQIERALNNPAPDGDGADSAQTLLDLLDQALPLLQGPKWQPMETVPMDGREVLVKVEERRGKPQAVHVAQFLPNVSTVGQYFSFDMPPATGWMPAPEIGDDA